MKAAALALIVFVALQVAGALGECPTTQPGDPLPGLSADELQRFKAGRAVFERVFQPDSGLGPLFNADACGECHESPVTGGVGDELEFHAALTRANGDCDLLLGQGGPVFQSRATPALTRALGIDQEPIPEEAVVRAIRTSPDLFGFGLLDAISERDIVGREDPDDANHDGVSGRANRFLDGRIGRFGRKAFLPALDEFNAGAFVIEMGITNPGALDEGSIGGAPIPPGVDPTSEPELSAADVALVNDFVRFLAPPARLPLSSTGERGKLMFGTIGCASCHTPSMRTGPHRVRALDRRVIAAYTDLLLHDMGAARADICLGLAQPAEFRTEPLMGLRLTKALMHDGAASTIEEAIELHDGEAAGSRERFRRLQPKERAALLEFLRSL